MASNLRGIFITNPHDLDSTIPGGVQICSREFLKIIQNAGIDIKIFEVEVSQKWTYRFLRALRLDAYHLYDTQAYADALYEVIENFQATYIFINKSELVKFAWLMVFCLARRPFRYICHRLLLMTTTQCTHSQGSKQ